MPRIVADMVNGSETNIPVLYLRANVSESITNKTFAVSLPGYPVIVSPIAMIPFMVTSAM